MTISVQGRVVGEGMEEVQSLFPPWLEVALELAGCTRMCTLVCSGIDTTPSAPSTIQIFYSELISSVTFSVRLQGMSRGVLFFLDGPKGDEAKTLVEELKRVVDVVHGL